MAYGLSFAAISSLIVYTFLHNRKQIYRQYKNSTTEKPDIHMKLMRKYKEAPTWWYMSLFAVVSPDTPAAKPRLWAPQLLSSEFKFQAPMPLRSEEQGSRKKDGDKLTGQ
jgi:hypothetical protein